MSLVAAALALAGCMDAGAPVTKEFDAAGVEEVVLSAPGDMTIVRGDAETLTMDTGENVAERIDVTVEDGVMEIEFDDSALSMPMFELEFELEIPNVVALTTEGSGSIEGEGFKADTFFAETSGSGNIAVDDLSCDEVVVDVAGSGGVEFSGRADVQSVTVAGSGSYEAEDLRSDSAEVTVSGSGSATVWVERDLDASVAGSGSIRYYGDPEVERSVSGSGDVTSLGSK
jgi:hypothetical protein